MRLRLLSRRWALLGVLVAGGCGVAQPAFPLRRFFAGDIETMRQFATDEAQNGAEENLALVLNVQAQCEMMQGSLEQARRTFEQAAQIMGNWSTSGGEVTAAILGSESSKTYKGDPYEKAMNAFYLAYCYLRNGEPDNARAALKRGILADAEVADEAYQADNALLFWMAGRMSTLMGVTDAESYFAEARTAQTFAMQHGARGDAPNPVLDDPQRGNVVLLVECGIGPEKFADGQQEELARFRSRPYSDMRAQATLRGQLLGRSTILADVDYQARTLGGTAMEGIREGKAVFKSVTAVAGIVLLDQAMRDRGDSARTQAIAGGALLLLSLFTSTAADVRHWPTLPSTVQVLTAQLPPGEHELIIEFLDASGRAIPSMQRRLQVQVPERGEAWHLVRAIGSSVLSSHSQNR